MREKEALEGGGKKYSRSGLCCCHRSEELGSRLPATSRRAAAFGSIPYYAPHSPVLCRTFKPLGSVRDCAGSC